MTTNWKELLEKRRTKVGDKFGTSIAEESHASLEPLLLKALDALEKLTIYSDLGGRISGKTVAEIREELEKL